MTVDNTRSKYKFLQASNKNHLAISIAVTYIPILLITVNVLVFHNVILGFVATSAFLVFNGHVVYEKLKFMLGDIRWIGIAIGAFIFLAVIFVISSPFVLFSGISSEHLVGIIAISGIPIVVFRIKDNLPVNPIVFQKIGKINRYDLGLIAIWVTLLMLDIFVLLSNVTSDSTFLWLRIPSTHLYVFFFFLLVTGVMLFRNINIFVRSVIITASIIFVCSYTLIVVPTLYSNDTWFLLGEINGALNHDHLQTAQNILEQNVHKISLGPFKIPEQYVTVWSRGLSNTFGLYASQLLSNDSMIFWRSLSPIFAFGATTLILFRIGHIVSKNYLFSLLLPTSFLFYSGLVYYMSQTVKLSISMPFFVLGLLFWIVFLLKKDRKTFLFALIVTILNIVNYSLYFLILFDIMIISIFVKYVMTRYFNSNRKVSLLFIPVIVGALSLVIPFVQTLLGSSFVSFDLSSQLPKMIYWIQVMFGYYLPEGESIPYGQFIATTSWFFISHVIVFILFLIGAFRFNFDKNIRYTLLLIVSTLHISAYVTENLMTLPHALGYITTVLHVMEIPFVAFGIFWLFEKCTRIVRNPITRKIIVPLLCILVAVLVESSQVVETGTAWLTPADIDATKYILQIQKNDTNYALISSSWGSYPLYYLTGGEKLDGSFHVDIIPGVKSEDRAMYYYSSMQNSTDPLLLAKAANETNSCVVYYLKPSWVSASPSQLGNVTSIMGLPIVFKNNHQQTFLFGTSYCGKNNPLGSIGGIEQAYAISSTGGYDESLKTYDKMLQNNKTDVKSIVGKATILEQIKQYSDALKFYTIAYNLDPTSKEAKDGKSRILNVLNTTSNLSVDDIQFEKSLNTYDKILESDNVNKDALIGKASLLEKMGRYSDAFETYTVLIKNNMYDQSILDHYATVLSNVQIPSNFDNSVFTSYVKINLIDTLNSKAEYFNSIGQYRNSQTLSDNVLRLDDSDVTARSHKVSILVDQKNYDAAKSMFYNFKDKFASVRDSELKEAVALENENELDKSLIIYKKILENDKSMFKAEMDFAKLLVDIGLTNAATSLYVDVPNMYHNQVTIWNKINGISEKQGRLDLIVYATFGLTKFDDYDIKNTLSTQAEVFSNEQNAAPGLLLVSNAILSIYPTNMHALLDKAASLTSLKAYDNALSILDYVISIDPTNTSVLIDKAGVYNQMKNYDKAISLYDEVLAINPNNISALENKVAVMITVGQLPDAIELINRILTINPNDVTALTYESMILTSLNRYDESLIVDDKILLLDSKAGQNLLGSKADLFIKSGQYGAALSVLNKLLILQPTDHNLLFDKAFVLEKLTRYDESLSTIDQMLSYNSTDVMTLNAKAIILIQMGKPTQAIDVYDKILSINPSDTQALENKTKLLTQLQSK